MRDIMIFTISTTISTNEEAAVVDLTKGTAMVMRGFMTVTSYDDRYLSSLQQILQVIW